MANITPYIDQIQNATYGEEVRSSIINALELINDDNESYQEIKEEIVSAKDTVEEVAENISDQISTADGLATTLEGDISVGQQVKSELEDSTTTAQQTKGGLDSSIQSGTTLKGDLEDLVASGSSIRAEVRGYAETATQKATEASQSAGTAVQAKDTAVTAKNTAVEASQTAVTKAGEALQSSTTATQKATEAGQSAQTAVQAKDTAVTKATEAGQSAQSASQSAQTATQKAQEALQSAQSVSDSATQIQTNKNDISAIKADFSQLVSGKNLVGAVNGILYPVHLKQGDVLTVSTQDGRVSSGNDWIVLFNPNGVYADVFSIGQLAYRTFTLTKNADVRYVSIVGFSAPTDRVYQLEIGNTFTQYEEYFLNPKELSAVYLDVGVLTGEEDVLAELKFINGVVTLSNGLTYSINAIKNRLRSREFRVCKAIRITAKTGYEFSVLRKVDGRYVSATGWTADSLLLNDCECIYCIDVKATDDGNIGFNLIGTYISAEYTDDAVHGKNLIGSVPGKLYKVDINPETRLTMSTKSGNPISGYYLLYLLNENKIMTNNFVLTSGLSERTIFPAANAKYAMFATYQEGLGDEVQLEYGAYKTSFARYIGSESEDLIPETYYMPEMMQTIASVRAELTDPCLVFPLITDIHYISTSSGAPFNVLDNSIKNIKWFAKNVRCDFLLNLGDNTDGNLRKTLTTGFNNSLMMALMGTGLDYYQALGNHDTNYYASADEQLTMSDIYGAYFSPTQKNVKFRPNSNGTEFYVDYEIGIRLVVLNVNYGNGGRYAYSADTATWLTSDALSTENIVLLAEHLSSIDTQNWSNTLPTNANSITSALQSFVNNGGVLIQLCGHSHSDYAFSSPWTTVFSCCNKCQQVDVSESGYQAITGYIDGLVAPERTPGTYTEDCWTVVVVKPESRKISLIRFGAGSDRTYNF